jgi:phage gp16-like protein
MPDKKSAKLTADKPIDSMQCKLIHIAKAKLGLSDEGYRTMLSERYWVNTCKELSYDDATDLIKHFQTLGFKIVTKRYAHVRRKTDARRKAPNIIQLVSPQQLALIEHLRADITWYVHDGYFRWLKKWLKKDRITTEKEARNVIEALKGMLKRQQNAKRMEHSAEGLRRDGGMHGGRWQW